MSATKLGRIVEAVELAHVDLRVATNPAALHLIGGIVVAGNATHDELLGVIMRTHRRLDAVTQCRLAARIETRLKEPLNRSAPQRRPAAEPSYSRRPAGAEMVFGPAGRILAVEGRSVR